MLISKVDIKLTPAIHNSMKEEESVISKCTFAFCFIPPSFLYLFSKPVISLHLKLKQCSKAGPCSAVSSASDSKARSHGLNTWSGHLVLVNRLGGQSLSRNSVVRLADSPDVTIAVYSGYKITTQQHKAGIQIRSGNRFICSTTYLTLEPH